MEWPDTNEEYGWFEPTPTHKSVLRRAAEACLADITEDHSKVAPKVQAFKERLLASENWDYDYRALFEEFTNIMACASTEQALDMAQAGIDALHDLMLYRIDAITIVPAKDVFVLCSSFAKLETVTLMGTKPPDIDFQWALANPQNTQDFLYGLDACAQVDAWYNYGVLETSASVLAKTTLTSNTIPSVISNKIFVLLGCTSELGPARSLIQIPGATIMGVARGGKKLDDLIDYVRFNAPDDTTFMYPKKGADLITQGPQVAQWILDNTKPEQQVVICPLAYLDGEANVRVAVAMDLIVQRLLRQRPNTILSQYMSCATVMVLPPTAATTAQRRLEQRPTWESWANTLTGGRWLAPSLPTSNSDYTICNGLITALGPNYALAKAMQMWRCMLSYYRDSHIVAAPYAPPTRTSSFMARTEVAAALEGLHYFEPMLAFDKEPASTLLSAILISQMQTINRPLPDMEENPFTIFWDGSVHGGIWTCPYSLESISTINWVLGKTYYPVGYIPEGALPKRKVEGDENVDEAAKDPKYDMFDESQGSEYGKPMPDVVRERLEFM